MSLLNLAKVPDGVTTQLWTFMAESGVGKSTLASEFPSPIYFDLENGAKELCKRKSIPRLSQHDIVDYDSLVKTLNDLLTTKHSYKTLIIDSLTQLEQMISAKICTGGSKKYSSIGDLGFGEGYILLADYTHQLMNLLRKIQETKDMDVVIIGHAKVKGFTDPYTNASYDRYVLACHDRMAEKVKSQSDALFFIKQDVQTYKDNKSQKTHASSDGTRVIYTEWRASADAKNRLGLPYEIPFKIDKGYDAIKAAIENTKPKESSELVADIQALMAKAPENIRSVATAKLQEAGNDSYKLLRVKTKLTEMVSVS